MRPSPYLFMRVALAVALLALGCAPLTSLAESPMQPGLWELRVTTTVNKSPQLSEGTRECLSQADIDHPTRTLPTPDPGCALSNITTSGSRVSYDMVCKRDEYTNQGRMDLVIGSANYDGMADLKVTAPGKSGASMTVMVNAKRVGDCTK